MNLKRLLFGLIFFTQILTAQFTLIQTVNGRFTEIEHDEQGNIYLINEAKHLLKLGPKLDTLFIHNIKSTEVDVVAPQNGLKLLTFNQNLNAVQYLDKTLSEVTGFINLDDSNIPLVKAIGISKDNNFWVFDENQQELKKLNTFSQVISTSGNLMNITGKSWAPILLKEQNNHVFVNDSSNGLMEFDFFGSYLKTIKTKFNGDFKVQNNQLWYLRNDSLIVRDLLFHTETKFGLPQKNILDFSEYNHQFFLLTQEKLYIYRLSKNQDSISR